MSPLSLPPLKKSIYKHFITRRFHYSRSFWYFKVWQRYFTSLNALSLGIGGDRAKNVLWRAKNSVIPSSLRNEVVLCGTNNLFTDSPMDIGDYIANIGSYWREKSSSINAFICGLIPRDKSWSVNRVLIKDVNIISKKA